LNFIYGYILWIKITGSGAVVCESSDEEDRVADGVDGAADAVGQIRQIADQLTVAVSYGQLRFLTLTWMKDGRQFRAGCHDSRPRALLGRAAEFRGVLRSFETSREPGVSIRFPRVSASTDTPDHRAQLGNFFQQFNTHLASLYRT